VTARILNRNAIRDQIYAELKQEIAALAAAGIRPVWPRSWWVKTRIADLRAQQDCRVRAISLGSWLHTPPATVSTQKCFALVAETQRSRAMWTESSCSFPFQRKWKQSECWKPWTRRRMWTASIR